MTTKNTSIQRKLMHVIMLTCGVVLLLTCAAFFTYEFITYRDLTKRELSTLGEIIAANSTASLAFDSREDADEILGALKAQRHIVAACLYTGKGKLFAYYPKTLTRNDLPEQIKMHGYNFKDNFLEGFEPVVQGNNRLGTLYLRSDMDAVYSRFRLYGIISIIFIIISFVFAYLFSKRLQRAISTPILELAQTARIISDKQDYTVRGLKRSNDEVGVLTDAFNHMLTQIQSQSEEIKTLNADLEKKVAQRTSELQNANMTLKQQNELIATIIDSSVDLIAVFNRKMEYISINKHADKIYQRNREELIGKHILDVFPKLKGSAMVENLQKALAGEFVHHNAYKSLLSDRYFENFFIPLFDKDGTPDRVLVIGHDITNIMQANEKLKLVNEELEISNQELEQFAYVASHDLQEPLRKIRMFSELSKNHVDNHELLINYLQKINYAAGRMTSLIDDVLNYGRLSKTENASSEIHLESIVENIKSDLELVIEGKKAVITTNQLPVIWGNPLQIHQLFLNLISNSLKFCESSPRITITATLIDVNRLTNNRKLNNQTRYYELVFSDNGIGFEQKYADQIFAIFQRLHSKTEYEGTGIGLAICKKIVENHHGIIHVESEPGIGTRFYVYLPVIAEASAQSNFTALNTREANN